MPHYKDGTEARVGDQVAGKLYNTPGVRAGTIISITPGVESCNAMVGFVVAVPADNRASVQDPGSPIRMAVHDKAGDTANIRSRTVRGEQHGAAGATYDLIECADYCAINELTKLSD